MPDVLEQREFRADPLKLKRLRISFGLNIKDFAKAAELDRGTASKIFRGEPVYLRTLAVAVQRAFGINNPLELLHPDELAQLGIQNEDTLARNVLEWEIVEFLSPWCKTANGLQYQLVKLKHRYLDGRFARAKRYELRHLPNTQRDELSEHLRRHVAVSEMIGAHPSITRNLTAALIDGLWWIIDDWHDGESLSHRLVKGELSEYELKFITLGIAEGLRALHIKKILLRDLTPEGVILRANDDRAILADLELAKLSVNRASVSPSAWPDGPYRAVEVVASGQIDERADVYSWARIFFQAATGILPKKGEEDCSSLKVPRKVQELVTAALSIAKSRRPKSIKPIIEALKAWP